MQRVSEKFFDELDDGLYLVAPPTTSSFSFFLLQIGNNTVHWRQCTGTAEHAENLLDPRGKAKQLTSTVGRICLTDFSLEKIPCCENGHQGIKVLVRPSATESSVSGEFVMQEWNHKHPKLRGRRKGDSITLCDEAECWYSELPISQSFRGRLGSIFQFRFSPPWEGSRKALQWFLEQRAWRQGVQVWSSTVTSP